MEFAENNIGRIGIALTHFISLVLGFAKVLKSAFYFCYRFLKIIRKAHFSA